MRALLTHELLTALRVLTGAFPATLTPVLTAARLALEFDWLIASACTAWRVATFLPQACTALRGPRQPGSALATVVLGQYAAICALLAVWTYGTVLGVLLPLAVLAGYGHVVTSDRPGSASGALARAGVPALMPLSWKAAAWCWRTARTRVERRR